jgi:hypothetical protein
VKTDVPLRQRLRFLEQDLRFAIRPRGPLNDIPLQTLFIALFVWLGAT